jgi:thiol-disulfide isomerase/thioredoxin
MLGLLCAIAVSADTSDAAQSENGVLEPHEATCNATTASHPLVLVTFYAPWCAHCKQLVPHLEEVVRKLSHDKRSWCRQVALAKVDAVEEQDLYWRYNIEEFPTTKIFRHGIDSGTWEDKFGGENAKLHMRVQGITDALEEMVISNQEFKVREMNQLSDLKDLFYDANSLHKAMVIAIFDKIDGPERAVFDAAAAQYNKQYGDVMEWAVTASSDVAKHTLRQKDPVRPSIVTISFFLQASMAKPNLATLDAANVMNGDAIVELAERGAHPLVLEVKAGNAKALFSKRPGSSVHIVAVCKITAEYFNALQLALTAVGGTVNLQAVVSVVDGSKVGTCAPPKDRTRAEPGGLGLGRVACLLPASSKPTDAKHGPVNRPTRHAPSSCAN